MEEIIKRPPSLKKKNSLTRSKSKKKRNYSLSSSKGDSKGHCKREGKKPRSAGKVGKSQHSSKVVKRKDSKNKVNTKKEKQVERKALEEEVEAKKEEVKPKKNEEEDKKEEEKDGCDCDVYIEISYESQKGAVIIEEEERQVRLPQDVLPRQNVGFAYHQPNRNEDHLPADESTEQTNRTI